MAYENDGRRGSPIPDDADGARFLFETGRQLSAPSVVKLPENESKRLYALYNPASGEIAYKTVTPPPLIVKVATPADLVDVVRDRGSEVSRIFLGDDAVTGLFNIGDRTERVVMELTKSGTHECLGVGAWKVEGLIAALRNNFTGERTGLLPLLRLMNLRKGQTISAENQHGAASLSTDVQRNALFGGKPPPEFVEFEFALYEELSGPEYTQVVRATFDVDVDKATLMVKPVAPELIAAELATRETLAKFLRNGLADVHGGSVQIFRGELVE